MPDRPADPVIVTPRESCGLAASRPRPGHEPRDSLRGACAEIARAAIALHRIVASGSATAHCAGMAASSGFWRDR